MSQIKGKHAQRFGTTTGGNRLKSRLIGVSLPALLIGGVLIGAGIVGAGPALAQQSGSAPTAAGEARISFNIPAQSLESAVTAFGVQSGYQIAVDQATLSGLTGTAVRGNFTPAEALSRLLSGTGVSYRLSGENSITLMAAAQRNGDAVNLAPITVEGRAETAYGPVDGYKASRSATATKTGAAIADTPAAIQVIPAEIIADQGISRMEDVLRNVASVSDMGNDHSVTSQNMFMVRGFWVNDIFKDGMRLTNSGQQVLSNVERVEVLKGPASLLYGSLEPGGMINIVTKKPLPEPEYRVEFGTGSFGYINPVIDATGPLGNGKVLYRFIGSYAHSDTYTGKGDDNRTLLAPSLTLLPNDDLKIDASFELTRVDTSPIVLTPIRNGRPDPRFDLNANYQADFAYKRTEEHVAGLGVKYSLNDSTRANLDFSWKRRMFDESILRQFTGTEQPDGTRNRVYTFRDIENQQYAVEGKLIHEFAIGSTEHTLLFGGDFRRFTNDYYAANINNGFPAPIAGPANAGVAEPARSSLNISRNRPKKLSESGIYLQDEAWFLDRKLKLVGTLRHTRINNAGGWNVKNKQVDSKTTPRLGALYKLTPDTSVYASYATSFEAEIGNDRHGKSFVPSEGTQYEAGIKQEFFDGKAAATLSVYQLTQTNVKTTDPNNKPGEQFQVQTGEVRSRGVELDVSGRFLDRFSVYAAGAYLDSEITKTNVAGRQGKRNNEVPKFKGSLWLNYDLYQTAKETLSIGGGVFGETSNFLDAGNTAEIPGYATVDLGTRYDFEVEGRDLTAQLNITNLLDQDHFTGGYLQRGQPRTVLGRIAVKF